MWRTPWESGREHARECRVCAIHALLLPSARMEPCSPTTSRGEVKTREHEDRDLPAGLVLILDKNRHLCGLAVEQALALLPSGHGGLDSKALVAHFDRRLRVREEVVVLSGVLGGAGERGDHDEAIAIRGVYQGFRYRPTTSGAGHRQEQHGHIGELPAHLPLMRAEFTNHALIEILQFRHISSCGR